MDNPYSSPQASVDARPRTRRSKETGNEGYFKTARAHMALGCLAVFALLMLLLAMAGSSKGVDPMPMLVVAGVMLFSAALHFAVWWGAKRRQGWARIVSIVLGVLSLPGFPVGTIIGVYLIAVAWKTWQEPEYYEQMTLEGWPGQAGPR